MDQGSFGGWDMSQRSELSKAGKQADKSGRGGPDIQGKVSWRQKGQRQESRVQMGRTARHKKQVLANLKTHKTAYTRLAQD